MSWQDDKKEVWVDYLENELDPSIKEDLSRVLTHSRSDEKFLTGLANLRTSLKKTDASVKEATFNEALYSSIMSEVEGSKITPRWRIEIFRPQFLIAVAASAVAVIIGVTLTQLNVTPPSVAEVKGTQNDWLLEASLDDPQALAQTVNDYQADNDFVFEALANKMYGLSDDEVSVRFEELINE